MRYCDANLSKKIKSRKKNLRLFYCFLKKISCFAYSASARLLTREPTKA